MSISITITGLDIPEVIRQIENVVLAVNTKVTLDAQARVTQKCPVDTGAARNSITSTLPTAAYGVGVVSSNCVYMPALENGHSDQAPMGFWAQSAEEAAHAFK